MVKGFRPTLGYGFCCCYCFVFLVSPKVFRKPTNIRENLTYKRKPKKTNKPFGKTKKTKFLKVSDPPLDMVVFFPRRFLEPKQTLEKTKHTKERQRKPNNTKNTFGKTNKKVFKGFRPTLGYGFVFCFCCCP